MVSEAARVSRTGTYLSLRNLAVQSLFGSPCIISTFHRAALVLAPSSSSASSLHLQVPMGSTLLYHFLSYLQSMSSLLTAMYRLPTSSDRPTGQERYLSGCFSAIHAWIWDSPCSARILLDIVHIIVFWCISLPPLTYIRTESMSNLL